MDMADKDGCESPMVEVVGGVRILVVLEDEMTMSWCPGELLSLLLLVFCSLP